MKLRLAILVCKDPGFWEEYVPQSLTKIHEVVVDIPPLPDGWTVHRVMVCETKEEIDR